MSERQSSYKAEQESAISNAYLQTRLLPQIRRGSPRRAARIFELAILTEDQKHDVTHPLPASAMVALVGIEAACIVAEAIKIITRIQPPALVNKLKVYNFDDISIATQETWSRVPDCAVCS